MTEMIKNGESLKIAEQWWSGTVNYEVWSSPSQKIERKWKQAGKWQKPEDSANRKSLDKVITPKTYYIIQAGIVAVS